MIYHRGKSMKTRKYIILAACVSLLLVGCRSVEFVDSNAERVILDHLNVNNVKTTYRVGDVYKDALSFDVEAVYSDGHTKALTAAQYKFAVTKFSSVDNYSCDSALPVEVGGEYISNFMVSYSDNGITKSEGYSSTNTFQSLYELGEDECTSFAASLNNVLKPNDLVLDNLDLKLEFKWNNAIDEVYYLKEQKTDISMNLIREDYMSNCIDQPLQRNKLYTLSLTYKGHSTSIEFRPSLGVTKVNRNDLTILPTDFNSAYSPKTSTKVLVVPVTLTTENDAIQHYMTDWDATKVSEVQACYNSADPLSFKSYYHNLGINMDAVVIDPVEDNLVKVEDVIMQTKPWNNLYALIARVFEVVKTRYTADELAVFDSNNDGQVDNFHLIPNYNETHWGTAFWPHQGLTFNYSGTPGNLCVNNYCVGSIDKSRTVGDLTQIHEQGHVFGLLDYYDYSNLGASEINYIGHADMQSDNMFDWNSYSKLSVGLVDPYVITGYEDEVVLDIGDSATTGDCLIIPADYSTWNGSAYDEYFLVELFSKKGINEEFWDSYGEFGTKDFGVRIYHVDARLYDQFNSREASDNKNDWSAFVMIGTNNCSDYTALGVGNPKEWGDFKQLALIQKEGVDTFGDADSTARKYLNDSDMFYAGEEFSFSNYKHFLSKSGQMVTSMDNGENFDWKIEINSATINSATIRVYR